MRYASAMIVFLFVLGCKEKEGGIAYSFNERDFRLGQTLYDERDSTKTGEKYVSTLDPKLMFRRLFWENGKVRGEVFWLGDRQFGPVRLYDTLGKLVKDTLMFNPGDTSGLIFDKEKLILRKK